jgi:hypothetical protein
MIFRGCLLALTGQASEATYWLNSGITALASTEAVLWGPYYRSYLAGAYAELGRFDEASRCIGDAKTEMRAKGTPWYEAEVNRVAGEIVLRSS